MTECNSCGARVRDNEHYCGNCGAQLIQNSVEFDSMSATLGDDDNAQPREGERRDLPHRHFGDDVVDREEKRDGEQRGVKPQRGAHDQASGVRRQPS